MTNLKCNLKKNSGEFKIVQIERKKFYIFLSTIFPFYSSQFEGLNFIGKIQIIFFLQFTIFQNTFKNSSKVDIKITSSSYIGFSFRINQFFTTYFVLKHTIKKELKQK